MLGDLFFFFISLILYIISFLLSVITLPIPSEIEDSFVTFFSYVKLGNGIFPFSDALAAISFVLTAWILIYVVKIYLFGFSIIPWLGKNVLLPTHTTSTAESVSNSYVMDHKTGAPKLVGIQKSRRGSSSVTSRNPFQRRR